MDIASSSVRMYFDGAWIQKTQGDGHDQVSYAFAVLDSSGNNSQSADNLGDYNDRGGPAAQEVRKVDPLVQLVVKPEQSAVGVFAIYGTANGIDWNKIINDVKTAVTTMKTVVDGYIFSAGNAEIYAQFVDFCVNQFSSGDPDGYIGSVRIDTYGEDNGHTTWSVSPIDNCINNIGLNPNGSWSICLKSPKQDGEYWPKLGVKAN